MAKKTLTLGAGVVVLCALFGGYALLKTSNEKAEQKEAEETVEETIINLAYEDVASIKIPIDGNEVTFLQEDGTWSKEDEDVFPVDETAMENLLTQIFPLTAVRSLDNVEDINEYGLDSPQKEIVVTDVDGEETDIKIGSTNAGTGDDYVMLNDDSTVIYTISSTLRETISDDLYSYAYSEELPSFSSDAIQEVDVTHADGSSYIWKKDETTETTEEEDTEITEESEMAISNLGYLNYVGFAEYHCTDETIYGFGKQEITIIYKENDTTEDEEEETQDEDKTASITFKIGEKDEDGNYYVQLDGSKQVHMLSSATLEDILALNN